MSDKRYLLITGPEATATEVARLTGLEGRDTFFGVLIERPMPFNLDSEMEKLDRMLHPNKPRCICGKFAIMHRTDCPMWPVS